MGPCGRVTWSGPVRPPGQVARRRPGTGSARPLVVPGRRQVQGQPAAAVAGDAGGDVDEPGPDGGTSGLAVERRGQAAGGAIVFAVRQIVIMRQSNQMPIFITLIQEWRSPEFQLAERYVIVHLPIGDTLTNGLAGLTEEGCLAVTKVLSFFATIGFLIVYGILSEPPAVLILGYRADKLWVELEPLINSERKIQGNNDFAKFFEDFVRRVRGNWPPEEHYNVRVRRI